MSRILAITVSNPLFSFPVTVSEFVLGPIVEKNGTAMLVPSTGLATYLYPPVSKSA